MTLVPRPVSHPDVSVIVPTYNRVGLLEDAIASVVRQQDVNVELIIIDDGSTDGTDDLLSKYSSRLLYMRQCHEGPGSARNAGLRRASGRAVVFLDSDDVLLDGALGAQLQALDGSPELSCLYGRWRTSQLDGTVLREGGRDYGMTFDRVVLCHNVAPITACMFRIEALRAAGGFSEDPRLQGAEDWELLQRLSLEGHRFAFWPGTTFVYRLHGQTVSSDSRRTLPALVKAIEKQVETLVARGSPYAQLREQLIAFQYLESARRSIVRGRLPDAVLTVRELLQVVPHYLVQRDAADVLAALRCGSGAIEEIDRAKARILNEIMAGPVTSERS